jgi:hypothetical protein
MPYIKNREVFDEHIEKLADVIQSKGELNYVICELVGQLILNYGLSYTEISENIDAVHDAECELRHRILNPYEDIKIEQNGDLRSFTLIKDQMKGSL